MGLSGTLEDISIIDALQIIGLAGKSGVLRVESKGKKATIGFVRGRIVLASIEPPFGYMADTLVEQGHLPLETLHQALSMQRKQKGEAKHIGSILLEMGAVSATQLENALRIHFQSVFNEVASWTDGAFSFEIGVQQPIDDLNFLPDTITLNLDVKPQELLLEAARIYDECRRQREEQRRTPRSHTIEALGVEVPSGEQRQAVILLTTDLFIRHALKDLLGKRNVVCHAPVTIAAARFVLQSLGFHRPILVVDVDSDAAGSSRPDLGMEMLEELRRDFADMPTISFGSTEDQAFLSRALATGVIAHVPRPSASGEEGLEVARGFVDALFECIGRNLPEEKRETSTAQARGSSYLNDLCKRMLELRRNSTSATISLGMLRFVACYLDRSVLFLVRRDELVGLGAFGLRSDIADLNKEAAKLRFAIAEGSIVRAVVEEMNTRQMTDTRKDPLLEKLYEIIGAPARGEALLIPLVVQGHTISIIYADNGDRDADICPVEPMIVLAEHTSTLLENLLLRRKLLSQKERNV